MKSLTDYPPYVPDTPFTVEVLNIKDLPPYTPTPLPDSNPKSRFGVLKPSLSLIPSPFLVLLAKVMALGAKKYGAYNWRKDKVSATIYVDAAERHLRSWLDGEDNDIETKVSHLASVAACCAILIDAEQTGNLIDDRPPAGNTAELIRLLTEAKAEG